jgi:multisubunit Na+/H+ antiporter MnhF subunit
MAVDNIKGMSPVNIQDRNGQRKLRAITSRCSNSFIFVSIFSATTFWLILSIPSIFSMDLWIFADRGSFLHLDDLITRGQRVAIDVYYNYGLFPVLVQRIIFSAFGAGYVPILALGLIYAVALGALWAAILTRMTRNTWTVLGSLTIIPFLIWNNPNLPYVCVNLAIFGSLLLILKERYDLALAAAAVGALSVPSLPLAMFLGIACVIVAEWALQGEFKLGSLIARLAPGLGTYVLLAALLAEVFGWRSLMATILPISGSTYYKSQGWGFGGHALLEYLAPSYLNFSGLLRYWLGGDRVPWWTASTIVLTVFGVMATARIIRGRQIDARMVFVAACSAMHVAFFAFAYGPPQQHLLYDPILLAGVIGGIFLLPLRRWRQPLFIGFVALSAFTNLGELRHGLLAWRNVTRSPATAGLMANPEFVKEWTTILDRSKQARLFLLSYSSGPRHYFPTVHSPEPWFLMHGMIFPAQWNTVLKEVRTADIVVIDSKSYEFVERDTDLIPLLGPMCAESETDNFIIFTRNKAVGRCLSKLRHIKWQ